MFGLFCFVMPGLTLGQLRAVPSTKRRSSMRSALKSPIRIKSPIVIAPFAVPIIGSVVDALSPSEVMFVTATRRTKTGFWVSSSLDDSRLACLLRFPKFSR